MFVRKVCSVLFVCLGVATSPGVADEGLFSDVELNSVFDSTSSSSTKPSDAPATSRVRSVDHLGRLLRIEGFGFEKVGDRTYGATTKIDDWSFPTLITLSPDNERIGLILGLVRFEDEANLSSEQMLQLLVANQAIAPYQFSFNRDRERTELAVVLPNKDVDSGRLADEIAKLKRIGRDSSKFWFQEKSESKDESTIAETPAPKASPSPQPGPAELTVQKLIGRWAFAKSAQEAFALELTSAGKFKLAQVSNGKVTTSEGTFGLQGTTLVLNVPDASSLSGPVKMISDNEFQLTLANSTTPLVFRRSAQ